MNNIIVWSIIGVVSIMFGIFSRIAVYKITLDRISKSEFKNGITFWFFEVWRDFINYFMTGAIGYFFVAIRWPNIEQLHNLSGSDFVLGIAFLIGALGWWPYFIKNITEGIHVIIARFLKIPDKL